MDEAVREAFSTIRARAASVTEPISPLVDTPMEITEDRLAEIKVALNAYEQAKTADHDALRNGGRTPPRIVDRR
jgi:hypothetical protein